MFRSLRTRLDASLDRLSYYATIYAVGLAGLGFIWQTPSPGSRQIWLTGMVAAYILLSTVGMSPRIYRQGRRNIHLLLAVKSLLVIALVWLEPHTNFFIIWFYLQTVYALITLPPREAYFWLAALALSTLGLLVHAYGWAGGISSALIYISGFFFFGAFARLTRQAREEKMKSERLLAELQQAHQALQSYAAKAEALAVSEERNRMAREMHDTIGHRLTVAAVQLEAAERLLPDQPQRAAERVATVREQVRAALGELRRTVAALRQPLEDDLPLERALPRLIADFQQATGLQVQLLSPPTLPPLTPQQRLALFRAAQAGLTNVHKHAAATRIWLRLEADRQAIRLQVEDDGLGPQAAPAGFGLHGLRERAQQLGGSLRFGRRNGGGSRLEMTLPLEPPSQEA